MSALASLNLHHTTDPYSEAGFTSRVLQVNDHCRRAEVQPRAALGPTA